MVPGIPIDAQGTVVPLQHGIAHKAAAFEASTGIQVVSGRCCQFVHLAWLVAWLSCLPCRIWCNIIIMPVRKECEEESELQ
jgi:hypothetical protein